jgi:hypothetical protein
VVVSQPKLGNVFPAVIVGHFLGWKMGVVVNDPLMGGRSVVKIASGLAEEKKVVVEISSGHG